MFKKTTHHAHAVLALGLVLLAGCGGDDAENADPESGPVESPWEVRRERLGEAEYGDLDPAEVGLHIPWARNIISHDPRPGESAARLTDVSTSRHEGFDRVTFTFEPRTPGYRLTLVEEGGGGCDGTEPGTESPIQLAVEFERAVSSDGGAPMVEDRDRTLDYPTLAKLAQTCDEGDKVRWLLGTNTDIEYRLLDATRGTQLVIDLRTR